MSRLIRIALLAAALSSAPAMAQQGQPNWQPNESLARAMAPMPERAASGSLVSERTHRGTFNGTKMTYRAVAREIPLAGPDGAPVAVAVTYAYLADRVRDPAKRPVTFVWNGGPGASSMPLHMRAFGPNRILDEQGDAMRIVPNGYSILDATDLVFVDPVGTGASLAIQGKDASGFYGNKGDAESVHRIITEWLKANGREGSPVILIGESYGTSRAVAVLDVDRKAKAIEIDGIALLSIAFDDPRAGFVAPITLLPTLASVAWYHQAVDRQGKSIEQWYAEALEFAQTDYAAALIKGASLAPGERQRVAERMSQLIGLPADALIEADLTPSKRDFMLKLLAGRGDRTGQLDGRARRAIADSNFRPPFDDPSMSFGANSGPTMNRYLADEFGYAAPGEYRSLNLGVNSRWSRAEPHAPAGEVLRGAMRDNPALRLFSGGGIYDITTPFYAGEFTLAHAGLPEARREAHGYAAGHSVFEDPEGLKALTRDMRAFVLSVAAAAKGDQ